MTECASIDLTDAQLFDQPFEHFLCDRVLVPDLSLKLLDWLETEAPWKLVEADFYEQFEFSFFDAELPNTLAFLISSPFLREISLNIERLFEVTLSDKIDLTAHRLEPGQRIRVHNDYRPSGETHRLIVQLNRGWTQENGGALMLFNSAEPSDVHSILWPVHNSAMGFVISDRSNHAVSTIHSGERYTIVFSFYQENA